MEDIILENTENSLGYFVPITFYDEGKRYFFSSTTGDLKPGDFVVVETIRGFEIGKIADFPKELSLYNSNLDLKPVIRLADANDIKTYEENLILAKEGLAFTLSEVKRLGLNMQLISAEYTLDQSKFTVTYLADQRVDFRELLRSMAGRLHTRIELRQIGTRDKAKMIGGIGICGLPLCCTTWLNDFDGISINRAKNQMLALNIPKISGHCGKLICCLSFEDEIYTEAKKDMPRIGTKLTYKGEHFAINSLNVISRKVTITNRENRETFTLEEYNKLIATGIIVLTSNKN